jgi:4-cresol dehydrogenase (hydroxylating)
MLLAGERNDVTAQRGPRALETAIARMQVVVRPEHVFLDGESLTRHSRDTIPWQRTCAVVVYPGCREEVCQLVQIAAEHRLAVWTFSKGKNWGYGATMAARDGAVILVLERMNRILEVNEKLAYAVIEPGVTQKQLNDHLKANGIKLWADCTDSTPEGSVIGNALERGLGYTPYGDHFGHLCGLEVVLPDGTFIQTGGAPPNAPTWHTYKWGTGPYLEGLFSQSNFGIVTQAGVWLMPQPETFQAFVCEVPHEKHMPDVLDALRRLALNGAVRSNVHMVNDFLFLTLLMQYPHHLRQGQSSLSETVRAELRQQYAIAPWTLTGGLYGTSSQVSANRALVKRELRGLGRLTFLDDRKIAQVERLIRFMKKTRHLPVVSTMGRILKNCLISRSPLEVIEVIPRVYPILKGIPNDFVVRCAYFKSRRGRPQTDINPGRDGCGLIWFAPVLPLAGDHATRLLDICRSAFRKHGIDFSMSFIVVNPRSTVALMEIFYDKEDAEETARANALYTELCESTVRAGYQQYRTSVAYMDRILECAPEYQRLTASLKKAVDAEGTLAPGRYGVGPT